MNFFVFLIVYYNIDNKYISEKKGELLCISV